MLTTPERIRIMGKEFASMTDEQLNIFIEDASLEVSFLIVPEEHKERLARYLVAHLASVNNQRVIKEKVDVIERTYSDPNKNDGIFTTKFGQEYQRILDDLQARLKPKKSINLVVL